MTWVRWSDRPAPRGSNLSKRLCRAGDIVPIRNELSQPLLQARTHLDKLLRVAEARWREVNAPHLVALVRAGATFERGVLVERSDADRGGDEQAA